jgi:hypothetical protein
MIASLPGRAERGHTVTRTEEYPVSVHPIPKVDSPRWPKPAPLPHAFLPVHKTALGIAVGLIFGCGVFAVTAFHVVLRPVNAPPLELLAQFFYGYTVSWTGSAVGFAWGFFTGFVAGWFAAFVRNLVTAIMVFVFKTRGELAQTRDFLDHI